MNEHIINLINYLKSNLPIIEFIIFFVIGIVFTYIVKRVYDTLKLKNKFRRGEKGEVKALSLLKKSGFRLVKSQPVSMAYIWINGNMKALKIRADYLVEKDGKNYICEVKTGKTVGDPSYIHTRRQLLEYYLYFELPVIFVDSINKKIHIIEFAMPE